VAHICNHCEDFENTVTAENGRSLNYPMTSPEGELQVELYLHHHCADSWARDFGVELSALSSQA
jgi:hypothetical protein